MPPFKAIYTFIAVAKLESMTKAADVLNVSHSAVSQAIKSLENFLNVTLFVRSGRHVHLNEQGKRYFQQVAPAFETVVSATEKLKQNPDDGRLTINMVASLALHWWIPRVEKFQGANQELDVRISNIIGTFDLPAEGVDLAIIHGQEQHWQDYYCHKLLDDELVMVAHPDLAKSSRSAQDLLLEVPAIFVSNDRRKKDWALWCEARGVSLPLKENNLTFNTSVQAIHACRRKLGVLITHKLFIADDLHHELLTQVDVSVTHPENTFFYACHPSRLNSESVKSLRNWLEAEFLETT
ncbi:putative Bacterial regulator, LysR family [Vibrio nigripulchritudo SOn1]|uniref:Bacterial regulator, LysR family n=1 Tax=Vibrio nigripulchritudo SOn1 TaxID=1238450 RepID=A0AAV2VTB5_9VIBR|nr:LysR substrate-binding domain-containing protein [Vibrio nigripulchritudo]CCO47970.1 putative Bacterial regulator, LysR family [Vibrio nigripulchritudo SOn1]